MLSQKMQKALNEQITREFFSSYLYLAMAAWFEEQSLTGFAKWMRVQVQEESSHALIFFNYVIERGGSVTLGAIDAPKTDFTSPLNIFEKTYEHEQYITASINKLMDLAIEERDHATRSMLNWFVDEQVEEESNDTTILARLKLAGDRQDALFLLDSELGTRTYTVPAPLTGKI